MELFGFMGSFFLGVIASAVTAYYIQKAKNYATTEDIEKITRTTEKVLQQYREMHESIKFKNQLKLAALEKRLEKTQEAFTLWSKVKSNVHNQDELHNAIIEGQNWWWKNCLYLSEEARDAFWESLRKASNHKTLLQIFRDESTEDNRKQMNENWQRLHEAGRTIALSVGLPSTSEQLGEDQKPE